MNRTLKEAERLYRLGFGILWIKPKSKAPVKNKWTTGPRDQWEDLKRSFRPGFNVGVRLGAVSKIGDKFLSVIDIDVKSTEERHRIEAEKAVRDLFPEVPEGVVQVYSGRGNGSSHIYILTPTPASPSKRKVSADKVKVLMPSAPVNNSQREALSEEDLDEGYRIRPAWEVAVMGEGQQVLLPPSIHPDSGKEYVWKRALGSGNDLIELDLGRKEKERERITTNDWVPEDVEVFSSKLSDEAVGLIMDADCDDRSAALFKVSIEMIKLGWTDRQIMSVLTDQSFGLGKVAFDHAKTTSRERAANWVFNYTIKKARAENDAKVLFQAEVEEIPLSEEAAAIQVTELLERDWKHGLERTTTGANAGRPQNNLKNLLLILKNDVGEGVFQRDLFANRDRYGCDTPWGGKMGHELNDDDLVMIKVWCAHRFRFEPDQGKIIEAITSISVQNSFHPVRQYLTSLTWDGESRVDTWLKDYLHARGPEPYLSDVSRKILLAMIARVIVPGIKFDHIPILEGIQGIGKSSAAKILASPDWFADNIPDLRHPDARLNLQGKWVVEMGELSKLKAADLETIKAYIVSPVDRVRSPYGRKPFDLKRQSIFIGTTNESIYLKDKTGNRRFWPIPVGQCDFKGLEAARDQLFAEAMILWENFREGLFLDSEAKAQAERVQSERVGEDEESLMEDIFLDFVDKEKRKNGAAMFNLSTFAIHQLFEDFGPFASFKPNMHYLLFTSKILKRQGYEKFVSGGYPKWRISKQ